MIRVFGLLRWFLALGLVTVFIGLLAVTTAYFYLASKIPSTDSLKDIQLQVPLRVYSRDGGLIAEFGEKRRDPVTLSDVPRDMVRAVLAAEDERFYEHPGVDWQGLARAVLHLVRTGEKGPGGSTITMQVARNFFLGSEKTYLRKANEILLALKIERELSKDNILELYFNKIFLGHRSYGVGAAAQVYYGRPLAELDLAEIAMIAGLPKAPSRFNPIVNPARALSRRNYVLSRMRELNYIDEARYQAALATPVTARLHASVTEVDAPYVAEMVRAQMQARVGDEAYTAGYRVFTTVDSRLQESANQAVRNALIAYDRRHGYRGAELRVELREGGRLDESDAGALLRDVSDVGGLIAGVVESVADRQASVYTLSEGRVTLEWDAMSWARTHIDENRLGPEPKNAAEILAAGDVVRLRKRAEGFVLSQVPLIEGAIVALDPHSGAIKALAGGFDFYRSKFNRAIQAYRQPGSSFKPFVYSAALEHGFTPASLINDAPVVFQDAGLEAVWRPENYSGKFFGPTRMREALTRSRNLVSIRLLQAVGVDTALEHIQRFGFDADNLPRNLSLALGSGTVTPLQLASAYAVLANGGFRVEPHIVERVENWDGSILRQSNPALVCSDCKDSDMLARVEAKVELMAEGDTPVAHDAAGVPSDASATPESTILLAPRRLAPRVISAQNAWLMNSMLRDVIRAGTGRRAMALGRNDLAGKTGTTNDQRDAWFSGFNPTLVTTAWAGFDQLEPLGRRETGARAALPMWMDFMRVALDGVPDTFLNEPEGLVTVRIDPRTGNRASASHPEAVFETFRTEYVPKIMVDTTGSPGSSSGPVVNTGGVTEQLF